MRLTVLGSSGTYGTPGRPASGYLVEHDGTRLWVDAGPGTFAALQEVTDFLTLDAVILSHVHPDHCSDLFGFYHAVRFGSRPRTGIPTYVPEGLVERFEAFLGAAGHPIGEVCDFRVVDDGARVEVGEVSVRFARADHPVPTIAPRLEADGKALVYSADTGPRGGVPDLAEGAHLFLCEATYQGAVEDKPWPHHLTAEEAGAMARRAGVRRLMLTHLWPVLDPELSLVEAETAFDRPVALAVPGMTAEV